MRHLLLVLILGCFLVASGCKKEEGSENKDKETKPPPRMKKPN